MRAHILMLKMGNSSLLFRYQEPSVRDMLLRMPLFPISISTSRLKCHLFLKLSTI